MSFRAVTSEIEKVIAIAQVLLSVLARAPEASPEPQNAGVSSPLTPRWHNAGHFTPETGSPVTVASDNHEISAKSVLS